MVKIERIDNTLMFTDEANGTGFSLGLFRTEMNRLKAALEMGDRDIDKVYALMLKYEILVWDQDRKKLFRFKLPRSKTKPIKIEQDQGVDAQIESLAQSGHEMVEVLYEQISGRRPK